MLDSPGWRYAMELSFDSDPPSSAEIWFSSSYGGKLTEEKVVYHSQEKHRWNSSFIYVGVCDASILNFTLEANFNEVAKMPRIRNGQNSLSRSS
jgi:hypothetical protein